VVQKARICLAFLATVSFSGRNFGVRLGVVMDSIIMQFISLSCLKELQVIVDTIIGQKLL
jgi:hypothetical protein